MIHKNKALYLLTMLLFFIFSSCSKNGCQDQDAENFEPKADKDCGCCYYGAKGYIWYQKTFYTYLASSGVTSLKYYANDELAGEASSLPTDDINAPTFSTNNSDYSYFTRTDKHVMVVNLGSSKSKKVEVRITDQNGRIMWLDSVTFKANKILPFQL